MKLPKLNLRDLFWLVVVVAMALGWWLDRVYLVECLAAEQTSHLESVHDGMRNRAEFLDMMRDQEMRLVEVFNKRGLKLRKEDAETIFGKHKSAKME
jgi:hypothetical protein